MSTDGLSGLGASPEFPVVSTGPLWLFISLLLIVGGLWLWRRRQANAPRSVKGLTIEILATRSLGPRSHLAIIEAAGHRSLIATTAQGVHHLRDLPFVDNAAEAPIFSDQLEREGAALK